MASGNQTKRKLIITAKKVSLPGFNKVPIYDVLHFFLKEIRNDRFTIRAAGVAFFLLLALFPGIIFLFTLIPYIPIEGLQATLFNTLKTFMPETAFIFLQESIEDILTRQRFGLLSIGFVMAFFFSTNGVNAIMRSFAKSFPTFKRRTGLQNTLVSLKLTAILTFLLLSSVILIILGKNLIGWIAESLDLQAFSVLLLNIVRFIVVVFLFFFGIAFIYYYGPPVKRKWKFVSTGATLATIMSILISVGFTIFVNVFNLYNEIFGSLGTVLVILLWFFLNSLVLLIGFELNCSIDYHKTLRIEREKKEEVVEEPVIKA